MKKYLIGAKWRCDQYLRLYKSEKEFVWRKSGKTATKFDSLAAALTIFKKFDLKKEEFSIYWTENDGKNFFHCTPE
jgi:hypothetical protein